MRTFVFLLILVLVAACKPGEANENQSSGVSSQSSSGLSARIELEGEAKLGEVPVLVYLLKNGAGVSGAEVNLSGDMTHAGMVPVLAAAFESESGLYRSDSFAFTMAGDWIITAEIKLPDGSKETLTKSVTVVK